MCVCSTPLAAAGLALPPAPFRGAGLEGSAFSSGSFLCIFYFHSSPLSRFALSHSMSSPLVPFLPWNSSRAPSASCAISTTMAQSGTEMDGKPTPVELGKAGTWRASSAAVHYSVLIILLGQLQKNGSQSRATFCHFTSQTH